MNERLFIIIQPTVKNINAVHKPLRERRIIRLPESEFQIIDSRSDCFGIYALTDNFLQRFFDNTKEFLFLFFFCIFCYHREKWLVNPIAVTSIHIFSDSCIQQRLAKRCTRSRQKHIIQHFKSRTKLHIQSIARYHAAGQICRLIFRTIFRNRICNHMFHRFFKRFLERYFRFHCNLLKLAQIFPIHPFQFFRHIHISIKINITVGRMIVPAVKRQEILISQIRYFFRITTGLHTIRCIRK